MSSPLKLLYGNFLSDEQIAEMEEAERRETRADTFDKWFARAIGVITIPPIIFGSIVFFLTAIAPYLG